METNVIFEYLRNVYSTILLKDVVAKEAIRNVSFLENLVAYLIDNTDCTMPYVILIFEKISIN